MAGIQERLDKLRDTVQKTEFLEGKGLSNEINIRIFCYDPAEEMIVRQFIEQITADQTLNCRLILCNLYHIFLSLCEEIDIMDAIPEMEEIDGKAFLLEQLHEAIPKEEFVQKIWHDTPKAGDVLLLTGVGDVFPFMRVHALLETLTSHFSAVPILVMYPGVFDGRFLRLFNRLQPNPYYRAFNEI